jgi:outer membrane protein assembly factor BamA
MTKQHNYILGKYFTSIIIAVLFFSPVFCQDTAASQYQLIIHYVDKDSSFNPDALHLQTSFADQPLCIDYVNKLISKLNMQGYAAASVDEMLIDSASVQICLYVGQQQNWIKLKTDSIEKRAIDESGFIEKKFNNKQVDFAAVQQIKERILNYYEKNGFPFASVYLDSLKLQDQTIEGTLKVNRGPLYHIDSIRVIGKAKIANHFLQRYLGIANGSIYNRERLEQADKKILELPYVQSQQPSELLMLGTGSVLNLYLQPKRSSQVNFLVGFLPANNQTNKLQLTGDVNLNLKNSLGKGETILLNWQQLQLQSPRLNIGYQHPYVFKSAFGIDFSFGLFKKDSTFLQLNAQLGIQYVLSANQSGKLFLQNQSTTLLGAGVDTNQIKITKQLPPNIDVSSVNIGLDYEWNNTNYRLNPRSGNELQLITSAGIKTIRKNNDIISISDGLFNYESLYDSLKLKTYQLRAKITAAHYFPAGKRSTLKTIVNAGVFSSQSVFRNELFQIGGFKLLRGFDEESIYATRYGVLTAEYRYLVGLNSYLFAFSDAGWVKNKFQDINTNNTFISAGIGLLFETKFGLLNMSFAVGKRDDVNFDLRRASKIHFGYINYF